MKKRLAGVVAIPVTPFDNADRIDEDAVVVINRRMIDAGIEVITPNGNTGEYYSLTDGERRRCVELAVGHAEPASVLVGVGGSVSNALAEARFAREAGAEAVMVHQPVHPYISADGWIDYNDAIARAVPELGLVTYVKNAAITGAAIAELRRRAENFVGIKYALPDPVQFATTLADADGSDLVWIAGLAESYAPSGFAATATGFTSGLANVVPEVSIAFLRALQSGDFTLALEQWRAIKAFEDLRARDNNALNVSVVKEALHQLGLCDRAVRAPISLLSEDDRRAVGRMLGAWNVEKNSNTQLTASLRA
nr:dihydrodipicolinate synthase family protein [Rhodococcus sp. B10]